jgi:hypothetical protein
MAISRNSRRIMLTVPVAVADMLDRIRMKTGLAPTGFIRQMLVASLPGLEKMAEAVEQQAAGSPERSIAALRGAVSAAETQLQLLNATVEERAEAMPPSPLGTRRKRRRGRKR